MFMLKRPIVILMYIIILLHDKDFKNGFVFLVLSSFDRTKIFLTNLDLYF